MSMSGGVRSIRVHSTIFQANEIRRVHRGGAGGMKEKVPREWNLPYVWRPKCLRRRTQWEQQIQYMIQLLWQQNVWILLLSNFEISLPKHFQTSKSKLQRKQRNKRNYDDDAAPKNCKGGARSNLEKSEQPMLLCFVSSSAWDAEGKDS